MGTPAFERRQTTIAADYFTNGGNDPYTDAPNDASTQDTDISNNSSSENAITTYDGLVKNSFWIKEATTIRYI